MAYVLYRNLGSQGKVEEKAEKALLEGGRTKKFEPRGTENKKA